MNGGLLHAVECLSASELANAESGYRYFDFGSVADLLSRARKTWDADQGLESNERQLDQEYAALICDDSSLHQRFEEVHSTRPSEFAPYEKYIDRNWRTG
jgi:hypothetical protein